METHTHTLYFFFLFVNINVQLLTWFLGRGHVIFLLHLKLLGFVFVSHWVLLLSKHQQREKSEIKPKNIKLKDWLGYHMTVIKSLEKRVWDIKWQSLCKSEFHQNLSWSSGNVNLSNFEISSLETKQPKNPKKSPSVSVWLTSAWTLLNNEPGRLSCYFFMLKVS